MIEYHLKTFENFVAAVTSSTCSISLHTVFKYDDIYFLFYGNTEELYIYKDVERNAPGPGLYQTGEKIEKVRESGLSPGKTYVRIIELEKVVYYEQEGRVRENWEGIPESMG